MRLIWACFASGVRGVPGKEDGGTDGARRIVRDFSGVLNTAEAGARSSIEFREENVSGS